VLEVPIKGSVFGEDGMNGMMGKLITKQGAILGNALLSGIAAGIGQGVSQANQVTTTTALGTGTLWVFSAAMLQHLVADEYRGRVFAFEFAVMTLTQSVATVLAGIALDTLHQGPQDVVVGAALLCVGVTARWWWFQGRVQPQPAPTPLA
jgi:hypothetical protein